MVSLTAPANSAKGSGKGGNRLTRSVNLVACRITELESHFKAMRCSVVCHCKHPLEITDFLGKTIFFFFYVFFFMCLPLLSFLSRSSTKTTELRTTGPIKSGKSCWNQFSSFLLRKTFLFVC